MSGCSGCPESTRRLGLIAEETAERLSTPSTLQTMRQLATSGVAIAGKNSLCPFGAPARLAWLTAMYLARIQIKLKESILDPQGQAVLHALHNLNHREVQDVRIGKFVELLLESRSAEDAEQQVRKYCESLLSNPVIETFEFTIGAAP